MGLGAGAIAAAGTARAGSLAEGAAGRTTAAAGALPDAGTASGFGTGAASRHGLRGRRYRSGRRRGGRFRRGSRRGGGFRSWRRRSAGGRRTCRGFAAVELAQGQLALVVARRRRIARHPQPLLLLLVHAPAHLLDQGLGLLAVGRVRLLAQVLPVIEVCLLPLPDLPAGLADVEEDHRLGAEPVRFPVFFCRLLELAQGVVGLAVLEVLARLAGGIRQGGSRDEQHKSNRFQYGHTYPARLERQGSWHREGQAPVCGPPAAVPEPAESTMTAWTAPPLST